MTYSDTEESITECHSFKTQPMFILPVPSTCPLNLSCVPAATRISTHPCHMDYSFSSPPKHLSIIDCMLCLRYPPSSFFKLRTPNALLSSKRSNVSFRCGCFLANSVKFARKIVAINDSHCGSRSGTAGSIPEQPIK